MAKRWYYKDANGNKVPVPQYKINADDYYTKVMSDSRYYEKSATDTLLDSKVSKTDIVQSTGTSETAVMSQKATTEELQGKQDKDVLQYRTPKVGTIYIGKKEYSNDCICYDEFFAVTPNSLIKLHVESDLKIRVTEYTNDKTYIKQSSYANINALLLGDSTKYIRLSATYASRGYDANNPITIDAYKDGDFGYYANAIESINHEINSIIDALNKKQNHTPRIICSDPVAISLPNIDTTKKELDFGVDSIVVTRDNNYVLKNLDASGSYRKVSYASATSSALKLIFNVTTYKFSFIAYSQAIPTDSILIGAMRAIGSTDAELSVPFEYTVNGKYRKQDVVVGNEWVPLVWKDGYFNSNGGIGSSSTNFNEKYTENYISIEDQLQRCVLSEIDVISNTPWVGIAYYKRDKSFISRQVYNTTWTYEDGNKKYLLVDFDYPTDAVYLRVSLRTYNNANTYVVAKESILVNLWKSAIKATTSLSKESFVKGINHRGYNTIAPENTLSAFRLSVEKGFNTVECDVSFTSDNVPVILHDSTIDRTSNGTGNITQMTLEQVRQYDFGSWKSQDYVGEKIPTLDEFLVLCRNKGLNVYIEIKSSGAYTEQQLRMIVDKVHGYGMRDKVSYISFSISFLQTIHAIDPLARLGYIATPSESSLQSILALRGYNEIFIDSSSYTNNDCDLCKQAGVPLEIWTINNQSTISSLNTYISGVTSDNLNASKIVYNIS